MARWPFALLAFCLAFGVAWASTSDQLKTALHSEGSLHPGFHLVAFALLAFLLLQSFSKPSIAILAVLCLLGLAWGTEFREHLADGWPVERTDVLLDIYGIAIGTILGLGGRSLTRIRN